MRFLADENIPLVLVERLRALGHDVAWVVSLMPGVGDAEVLALAKREGRVLITFDKDFGEITSVQPELASAGLILFRGPTPTPGEAILLADQIAARSEWAGCISVIEPGRIRVRRLGS